jgi:hypothetical protein
MSGLGGEADVLAVWPESPLLAISRLKRLRNIDHYFGT